MEAEDVGALPILDGDQLIGMVTDRDIVIRAVAQGKDPKGMPVQAVASAAAGSDVVIADYISPDDVAATWQVAK